MFGGYILLIDIYFDVGRLNESKRSFVICKWVFLRGIKKKKIFLIVKGECLLKFYVLFYNII